MESTRERLPLSIPPYPPLPQISPSSLPQQVLHTPTTVAKKERRANAPMLTRKPTFLKKEDTAIVRLPAQWFRRIKAERAFTAVLWEDASVIIIANPEALMKDLFGKKP